MKNKKFSKAIIIILAVVSIGLAALYANNTINGTEPNSDGYADDIAGYGSEDTSDPQYTGDSVTVVSGTDGTYTITDDGTVEMDSIPNDLTTPAASDSDIDSGDGSEVE